MIFKFIHGGRILNFNFNFNWNNWNNYETNATNTVLNYGDRKLKEEKKKVYG